MSRIAGVCLAGMRRRVVLQSGSQGQCYATVPPIFLPTNIQIYGTPVMARFGLVRLHAVMDWTARVPTYGSHPLTRCTADTSLRTSASFAPSGVEAMLEGPP